MFPANRTGVTPFAARSATVRPRFDWHPLQRSSASLRRYFGAILVALASVAIQSGASAAAISESRDLIPTSSSLSRVHTLYARAHARERSSRLEVIEDWHLVQDGMNGTFRVHRLGRDYRETTILGPLSYENGMHAGVRWQTNRNGLTFTFAGFHERDAISDRIFEGPWRSDRDEKLIGESVQESAYVIEVNPPGGRHEWMYIDKYTGLLTRRDRLEKHRRYSTTYVDYKYYDGVAEPSKIKSMDSFGNEREQTLTSRTYDWTPDSRDVEIPSKRRDFVEFPANVNTVRLPGRFVNGLFVVRVGVNGKPYDFLLDSGAAGIVVDPSIAELAGIERLGNRIGATIGSYAESTAIVNTLSVGALKMQHVVTRVVPVPFRIDERTRVVGLLGFDFFADAIVHVDYDRGIAEAIDMPGFHAPDNMTTVALALDDKTPAVRAHVGNALARLTIDTGANRTLVFSGFADRADLSSERIAATTRFRGVGGMGNGEMARLRTFEFANVALTDTPVEISSDDFGSEDIDGILGADLLRNYDVYFNYPAAQIYVRRARHAPLVATTR